MSGSDDVLAPLRVWTVLCVAALVYTLVVFAAAALASLAWPGFYASFARDWASVFNAPALAAAAIASADTVAIVGIASSVRLGSLGGAAAAVLLVALVGGALIVLHMGERRD